MSDSTTPDTTPDKDLSVFRFHAADLTPGTLNVFSQYADDAGNWSGNPLVGGNVDTGPGEKGHLSDLIKKNLIRVSVEERRGQENLSWIYWTPAGVALAEELGIDLYLE